jgi:hypothetical protein
MHRGMVDRKGRRGKNKCRGANGVSSNAVHLRDDSKLPMSERGLQEETSGRG